MRLKPIVLAMIASALPAVAQPVPTPSAGPLPPPLMAPTGRPWLGLQLAKVDPSMAAQIQSLPLGVGFVVKSIDTGGPAELAQFQLFDVVWKMGDQLLINEAQLATLLRLQKPGDEIRLAVYRGGQPLVVKLKLGDLPVGRDGFSHELAEAAIFPGGEGGAMRVVNITDRTATYSTEEGKAVLRKEGDAYLVLITSPKEEVIFEGDVSSRERAEEIPKGWQRRVDALKRGLDHAMQGSMVPVRPPRPRVIPIPSSPP